MALTVYYEGLKRINTILISALNIQKQRILYIKIHWFGFSLEQEHFDILPNTV
jgi:hypothetical protein